MARIPKYRKQSGRSFAFVEFQGHRIRLPGDHDSTESRQAYAQFLAKISSDDLLAKIQKVTDAVGAITVARLCALYRAHAEQRYVQGSGEYEHYVAAMKQIKSAGATSLPIDSFGPRKLKAIRQRMVDYGWSRGYVNTQTNRICRMFTWGVSEELVSTKTLVALQAVKSLRKGETQATETEPVEPIDFIHVEAVLPHTTPVLAAMVRLQMYSGMRSKNICGLTPAEVDRSGKVWLYMPAAHKTAWRDKTLWIYFGPKAQAVLLPYLNRAADAYCFSPQESEAWRYEQLRLNRKTPTPSKQRKHRNHRILSDKYNTRSYRHALGYALNRANKHARKNNQPEIPSWHPSQIRHTVATEINKKYGIEAVRVFLGHASVNTTEIYAEEDRALAVKVAREIG